MCGIVGIFTPGLASDSQLRLFMDLLYVDKARGEHATGVIKVQTYKDEVTTFKRAVSSQVFLGQEDAIKFMTENRGRIYIGHNRYATMGDKAKDDNAHPFTEGHITMVHNGGVDRWALNKLEGYTDPDIVVDSHMLCKTIAEHGIDEAIRRFSGAAALVWWNAEERSLNFLRNAERPLYMAELKDKTIVWASEKEFIDFFVTREKSRHDYLIEPKMLPVGKHLSFHFSQHGVLTNTKPTVRDIEFKRMEDPNPPKQYGGYYSDASWWNRQFNNTTSVSTRNRASNANDNFNNRVNDTLKLWGSDYKMGEKVRVEIIKVDVMSNNKNSCNIQGITDDSTDVVIYNVDRAKIDGKQFMMGNIVNVIERSYPEGYKLLEIVVSANTLTDYAKPAPKVEINPKPVIYAPSFPMKVNGHSFSSRHEFTQLVAGGCEHCGNIPTAWDKNNAHLTVYKQASANPSCWDFICGNCIVEKELESVDISTK